MCRLGSIRDGDRGCSGRTYGLTVRGKTNNGVGGHGGDGGGDGGDRGHCGGTRRDDRGGGGSCGGGIGGGGDDGGRRVRTRCGAHGRCCVAHGRRGKTMSTGGREQEKMRE